jgi:hypothetical protein
MVEYLKNPPVDLNLLKYIATENAVTLLGKKYLPQTEAPADGEIPAEAAVDSRLVDDVVAQASLFIELAMQEGLVPNIGFIRSIAFEVSGAQEVQKDQVGILYSVIKPTEAAYVDVARSLIIEFLQRGEALSTITPELEQTLAEAKYEEVLNSLQGRRLDDDVFSQRGAQESILRKVILTPPSDPNW